MDATDDVLVSMREAASVLPVSLSYLYLLAKEGQIPTIRIGNKILLRKSVLKKLRADGTPPLQAPQADSHLEGDELKCI